jgi:hypothetical protein
MCQNIDQTTKIGVCACSVSNGCPGAGTVCDATSGTNFGFCAGGACQYNGLVPENAPGTSSPQWELAASCTNDAQCASGQSCTDGQCTCNGNSDCSGVGGTCSNGLCTGQTATICMPMGWGGRFWGRTGCSTQNGAFQCQTGQCGQGSSAVLECTNVQKGISGTATGVTLFEGTFDSNGTDFWDVSLVNGYNVPMMVGACGSDKLTCTFAGLTVSANSVGCVSDLNSTCPLLLQIQGKNNCINDSDCGSGDSCGHDNLCSKTPSTVTCIDPGDLCKGFGLYANNPLIPAPTCLQCSNSVDPSIPSNGTYSDLYNCLGDLASLSCNNAAYVCFSDKDCPYNGQTCQSNICVPVNPLNSVALCSQDGTAFSCSSTVNKVDCYECDNITISGQPTELCLPKQPSATEAGCCGPYNPNWRTAGAAANGTINATDVSACKSGSETYTSVFKAACPTAYSFQFDDPTSSYQCSDPGHEVNYLVTFCASKPPPRLKEGSRLQKRHW